MLVAPSILTRYEERHFTPACSYGMNMCVGAFIAATGELTMESLEKAIYTRFSGKAAESNWKALVEAYNEVKNREDNQ